MTQPITSFRGPHAFLSNFAPSPVRLDGVTYPTVEHAYQAAKTLSPLERQAILRCTTPAEARRAGRHVTLRPGWSALRLPTMLDLITQKFATPSLRARLTATRDARLVEGNTWNDTFWGVCRGRGDNYLGRLLMYTRAREN